MNRQEQIELLEEMMDLDDENLTEDTILEDIDEYDSFFKLYLVTYVKKELNKRLTVAEIEEFKTVKDICDYLSANEQGEADGKLFSCWCHVGGWTRIGNLSFPERSLCGWYSAPGKCIVGGSKEDAE